MFLSRTPNSPLKKSSPPFSFFLQNVHPLSRSLLPRRLMKKTAAAMPNKHAPPTPTTTPTTILLVLLSPPELLSVALPDEAEGWALARVTIEVLVTMIVRPLTTDAVVMRLSLELADVVCTLRVVGVVDEVVGVEAGSEEVGSELVGSSDDVAGVEDALEGATEDVGDELGAAELRKRGLELAARLSGLELGIELVAGSDSDVGKMLVKGSSRAKAENWFTAEELPSARSNNRIVPSVSSFFAWNDSTKI